MSTTRHPEIPTTDVSDPLHAAMLDIIREQAALVDQHGTAERWSLLTHSYMIVDGLRRILSSDNAAYQADQAGALVDASTNLRERLRNVAHISDDGDGVA